MAVVTGAIAAGVAAVGAGVTAVSSIKRANAQKAAMAEQTRVMKKQASDNLADLKKQQKKQDDADAIEADGKNQDSARSRQRAIASGAQGRTGTILAGGAGGGASSGLGGSGGGTTLLGG